MSAARNVIPMQREPELLGQTVVVIGGSAGIGLETARRARVEGAKVILTGRRGPAQADVTEGSSGIWERLHYDWSDPNHVVLTTTDSNTWGGASGHTYTFTRNPNGTTNIDLVVVREGKNLKGQVLGFVLRTIGRSVLEKAFENSVKAIEARNAAVRERAA